MRKQKNVPNKQKEKAIIQRETTLQYSGIIPPPNIIDGYERNCPGATDRILSMTERELANKQELEKREQENIHECRKETLNFNIKHNVRGQILGFILLFTVLVGGLILVFVGKEVGGYSSIVGSISLALGSIIWNNLKNKN